jgi:hypothetical protein
MILCRKLVAKVSLVGHVRNDVALLSCGQKQGRPRGRKISLPTPHVYFSPPKIQFYSPKLRFLFTEVFQYRKTCVFNCLKLRLVFIEVFFYGYKRKPGGEKETWGWEEKSSRGRASKPTAQGLYILGVSKKLFGSIKSG